MSKPNDLSGSVIFPLGKKVAADHFTGEVWFEPMVSKDSIYNLLVANVTFSPGARTKWHTHPGGQILLITGGKGYYQEEGRPAREIQTGDAVKIGPNVKHWHGAGHDTWLVHLAIVPNPPKEDAIWMESVSDEEYDRIR
jgi:quercetin dioxygenase-like cupin family protein